MIVMEQEKGRFQFRVVGIALQQEAVLLHRGKNDPFWSFPGGRVEFGESAEQALRREMKEEIDTEIELVRLLWVVENFFKMGGKNYHELSLYFLMRLPVDSQYYLHTGTLQASEQGSTLIFQWFPLDEPLLSGLPVLPGFLPKALQNLPATVQHIVHRDV